MYYNVSLCIEMYSQVSLETVDVFHHVSLCRGLFVYSIHKKNVTDLTLLLYPILSCPSAAVFEATTSMGISRYITSAL